MISSSIYFLADDAISFFCDPPALSVFFTLSSGQGHCGWPYVSAAVWGAAGSKGGQVSLWYVNPESSVDTPRMGGAVPERGFSLS